MEQKKNIGLDSPPSRALSLSLAMGHRNPDRVPITYRRAQAQTVAQMIQQRWDVISRCRSCGLVMRVDLKVIAKVRGPRTSLWNRVARCKRIGCNGQVEFQAKAPGMTGHEVLWTYDEPDVPGWAEKRLQEAERLRAEAERLNNSPAPLRGADI